MGGAREAGTAPREPLHAALEAVRPILDGDLHDAHADAVADALTALRRGIAAHVEQTEGVDGLLYGIVDDAPWLEPRARRLQADHERLVTDCESLLERAGDGAPTGAVCEGLRDLTRRIDRHRHLTTALLLDAYALDVPEGD